MMKNKIHKPLNGKHKTIQMRLSVHSIELQLSTEILTKNIIANSKPKKSMQKTIRCLLRYNETTFSTTSQTACGTNSWDITSVSSASSDSPPPPDPHAPLHYFESYVNIPRSEFEENQNQTSNASKQQHFLYCYVISGDQNVNVDDAKPNQGGQETIGVFKVPFLAARRQSCVQLGPFPMFPPDQVRSNF